MKRKIIVGGSAYADIDVVACASSYKQFFEILGQPANAVITPSINATVPPIMHHWLNEIEQSFTYNNDDCSFILVDISDPRYLNDFVNHDTIIEVFDHHYGFQDYWIQRLQNNAHIEFVGACATLIWEQFKKHTIEQAISPHNANLLYTAIFSNTLNFQASITHSRDVIAAQEILHHTNLPDNWISQYYSEIQKNIIEDPIANLIQDTKTITIFNKKVLFGQLEMYDAQQLIEIIQKQWKDYRASSVHNQSEYIINIVSIQEDKNYIITSDTSLQALLMSITQGVCIQLSLIETSKLWLRKEILREILLRKL